MDDQLPKEDENSAKVDFLVPESGPGQEAVGFNIKAQQENFLSGSSKKTFKIEGVTPAKEPVARRKRFEIHGQSPKEPERKLFMIESDRVPVQLPRTDREIMFARQRNASDCGPCLVLNTLQALGVNSGLSAVPDVRSYANQLRIAENERLRARSANHAVDDPTLPTSGWFTNIDVDEVLRSQGLNVRSWSVDEEEERRRLKDYTEELARGGQEFVVYTGSGRHYRGLYRNGENSIFELDSLRQDVPRVGEAAIENMITRAAQSDRIESISVASRAPTTQQQ